MKASRPRIALVAAALALAAATAFYQLSPALADNKPAAVQAAPLTGQAAVAKADLEKALAFLKTQQDPKSYTWGKADIAPGMTALALRAFVQDGMDPDTPFIDKGYDALMAFQKPDGGVYENLVATYNTAIAISAFAAAPGEVEYKEPMAKALKYLQANQWTDKIAGLPAGMQPIGPDDPRWGGFGYGGNKKDRPDMSNVHMAVEAMHDAGLPTTDPAYKAVVEFLSRSQNLSETNKVHPNWTPSDDGSFIYSPAEGGMTNAGEYTDDKGHRMLRGYGSMTYAGLKSMIYAGLAKDDARVKAAWDWIGKNWTLDENPGMKLGDPKTAQAGLYYYYHTLARALHAYGQPIITDPQGKQHDWRLELIDKLHSLQKPDGSWAGEMKWMEGDPVLVTCYGALAEEEILADLKEHPVK